MSAELSRWVLIVFLVVCLIGLLVWARGPEHHRGQYVGAQGAVHSSPQTSQA